MSKLAVEPTSHGVVPAARARPSILFIVDTPNWAHDFKTRNLMRMLGQDYDLWKRYQAEVSGADLEQADLLLVYYWFQFEAMPQLLADFERHRNKLLIGVCSHAEIEGSRGAAGLATLRRLARGVFAVNRRLYQQCKSHLKTPVFYTPNGVDTEFFRPAAGKRLAGSMRVGWAGSLHNFGPEQRGYYDLIVPAVSAVEGVELATAAREEQWRGPEEMREFYHSLDVYLCASRGEGTPNTCLEAAACGVPLLTTRVGNMPELIRHGGNGFLIEPDPADITHKLRWLRDDPALRASLAQTIRLDIQAWDWSIQAQAYRQMFEDTLRQRGSVAFIPVERHVEQEVEPANESSAAPDADEASRQRVKAALGQRAKEALRLIPTDFFAAHRELGLTIVMLSYGRLERTLSAVQALAENVLLPFRLLLIDNNSGAEVQSKLKELSSKYAFIDLVLQPENLGCAGGRVHSLQHVQTEYVMFLDNDIEVFPGTVEQLLYSLEANPQVVAAAGNVIFPDGAIHVCGGDYWSENGVLFCELLGGGRRFDDPLVGRSGSCKWVNGGLTIFRRGFFARHPYDLSMRSYYEDLEWCYRLNQIGVGHFYRNVEAVALHYHESKSLDVSLTVNEKRRQSLKYIETMAYFYQAHGKMLQDLFSFIPELGPATDQLSISAGKILLALLNSYGGEWVLDQWNRDGLASLFATPQLAARVAEKEQAISSLSARAAEREQVIAAPAQAAEREQVIAALSAQAAEREQVIASHSAQAAEREQVIAALSVQAAERKQVIASRSAQVAGREQVIAALSALAAEREQTVAALSKQINAITGSTAWKLMQAIWWLRRKLNPRSNSQNKTSDEG